METALLPVLERLGTFAVLGGLVLFIVVRLYQSESPLQKALKSLSDSATETQDLLQAENRRLQLEIINERARSAMVELALTQMKDVALAWKTRALDAGYINGHDLPNILDLYHHLNMQGMEGTTDDQ